MFDRAEAKQRAKDRLRGNWGSVVGAYFILALASGIPNYVASVPLLMIAISIATAGIWPFGRAVFGLKVVRYQDARLDDMFSALTKENYLRSFLLQLLISFFVTVWTFLLIIPGIIKAYSYSMSFYILADYPEMTASEALDASKQMTKGHKMDLFIFDLSFIGWSLLCVLTLGIGIFWLIPYYQISRANIYSQLKGDKIESKSNGTLYL